LTHGNRPPESRTYPDRATSARIVLVVDDDASVQRVLSRLLGLEGYQVVIDGDGREALQLIDEMNPPVDLVLTDLRMPGMDGYALAEELAGRPSPPEMLFMSAFGVPHRQLPGLFLAKPFDPDHLLAEIARMLNEGPAGGSEAPQ
jgi:CheY-like chemotaxis protein